MNAPSGILLVEDNPRDTEMALEALRDHYPGAEMRTVIDGAEALDYLYRRGAFSKRTNADPAVILLDLKMPKVGGLEVLRLIKEDATLNRIPVVVMTSSREDEDIDRSYQLGVNACIAKPLDFHQFSEAVRLVGAFWLALNERPPLTDPEGDNDA